MQADPALDAIRSAVSELRQTPRPPRRPFPEARTVRRALKKAREGRPEATITGHPWIPESLVAAFEQDWRRSIRWYVAVDDLDEGIVVFSAVHWPMLDDRHRLVFVGGRSESIDVPLERAESFLAAHRIIEGAEMDRPGSDVREEMKTRSLRIGDVFAMSSGAIRSLRDPRAPVGPRSRLLVFDVTSEARIATKIAFYAAASETIEPERAADRDLAETVWRERRIHEGTEQEA